MQAQAKWLDPGALAQLADTIWQSRNADKRHMLAAVPGVEREVPVQAHHPQGRVLEGALVSEAAGVEEAAGVAETAGDVLVGAWRVAVALAAVRT